VSVHGGGGDPTSGSIRLRRLRYLTRRVAEDPAAMFRRAVSARVVYLDRHHDPRRATLVVSSGRSGSTLLAELLTSGSGMRLMFEPFRADLVPLARAIPRGRFLEPGAEDRALAAVVTQIFSGRLRNGWADTFNTCRLPRGRVVKEVRIANLLPWLTDRFPEVPAVYLLRHPVATAWSVAELGWEDELDQLLGQPDLMAGYFAPWRELITEVAATEGRSVVGLVLRWCLENHPAIAVTPPGSAHVVFYEDLVARPQEELGRLARFLADRQPQLWAGWRPDVAVLARPSSSAWRDRDGSPDGDHRVGGWREHVTGQTLERCLGVLAAFGLDRVYGEAPAPRLAPDELLGAVGRRPPEGDGGGRPGADESAGAS